MKSPAPQAILYTLISVWYHARARIIKVPQRFKILLRSIGFGLLALVKNEEPRKILVYRSRLLALAHCAVHIIPAAGSFALVALNFQGRFIGAELQGEHFTTDDVKLGAIQVASKLHVSYDLFLIPAVVAIPMELPIDSEPGLGMAVLVRSANTTRFGAFSCTVESSWKPGQSIIESTETSNRGFHEFRKDRVRNVVTTSLGVAEDGVPAYFEDWHIIHINPSWYELLSPTLSDSVNYGSLGPGRVPSSTSRSLMERLLEIVLYPLFEKPITGLPSVRSVEYAISAFFVDGISRCGSTIQTNTSGVIGWNSFRPDDNDMARSLVFKGTPTRQGESAKPDLLMNHTATEMLMRVVFTGYLLAAIGSFDYFAIAIVLLHAAMALSYTALVFLYHPEIMEAFDTIPEMVAMAQNSPPPDNDGLKNTCAGIRNRTTLGRVAIVETSRALDRSDGKEELILRFQEKARDVHRIPEVGRIYGGIKSP
ncbi:hypothetical protein NUW58_g1693 [Xylaria curta]|uniref:Uncharacterized protein n=1 Tax=Xylaria curta TaxID=42375 RepID=A0ACC1PKN8_9PEZI|nr:hypothetical protein NUW58_g1693 [Xylaria curta]